MAVLRALFTLCILSVFAFGFFMTKRAHEDFDQIQALGAQGDCLDATNRMANEWDRTTAIGVCFEKAGAF